MATVKSYKYDYDPTGRSKKNLVKNERHTITPENRNAHNVIIPQFAPYYRNSLIVTDMASGLPLTEGIDYTCEWKILNTENAIENLRSIYAGIQFIDSSITGQFEIQYQTIGGQYIMSSTQIAQALANQANDPLTTTYEAVVGKPLVFPPIEHVHSIKDFVGFDDLVIAVREIITQIKLMQQEDRDSHPGYDTLIDEYFRLADGLAKFKQEYLQKMEENDNAYHALDLKFQQALKEAKDTLTTLVNDTVTDLTGKLEALRSSVNVAITQLTNDITNKFNTFKAETNKSISDLTATIQAAKLELKQDMAQLRTDVNTSINNAKTELTNNLNSYKQTNDAALATIRNNHNALEKEVSTQVKNLNTSINNAKTELKGEIEKLRTTLASDYVTLRTTQTIEGAKTFHGGVSIRNTSDATKMSKIGANEVDTYYYNPVSGKYLQLRNTGKLQYSGQDVIYNGIEQEITGQKYFRNEAQVRRNSGEYIAMNIDTSNRAYLYNSVSRQVLELHADGHSKFSHARLIGGDHGWELNKQSDNTVFLKNTVTGKVLYLQNNGDISYDGSMIIRDVDLTSIRNRLNDLENWKNSIRFEF